MRAPESKPFRCEECGKAYSEKAAERAMESGCKAGCSGLDIHEVLS